MTMRLFINQFSFYILSLLITLCTYKASHTRPHISAIDVKFYTKDLVHQLFHLPVCFNKSLGWFYSHTPNQCVASCGDKISQPEELRYLFIRLFVC